MPLDLVVIVGSVRTVRRGIRVARYVERRLRERGNAVHLVDPVEIRLPLLDRMYKEYPKGEAPTELERLAELYRAADGFVVVTAEYNHAAPPALTNLLDHFLEEYFWRPSGIVSYSGGQFGGVRAAAHLRDMLAELGMSAIPTALPFPRVLDLLEEDGTPKDPKLDGRFDRFAAELEWYAEALRERRARGVPR